MFYENFCDYRVMNPQGFLPVKPLPLFVVNMGQSVADLVKFTTGMEVPYQEGLMLIASTIAMAVFLVLWIIIDVGNRADRKAHNAVLESRSAVANRGAPSRRSTDVQDFLRSTVNGLDGSEGTSMPGGGAYAEKSYRRDGTSVHGGLRKKMV